MFFISCWLKYSKTVVHLFLQTMPNPAAALFNLWTSGEQQSHCGGFGSGSPHTQCSLIIMEKPYDCPASVPCDAERKQRWICLTVMTDSVVLRSSDLARLRGGRVEWWKSKPWAGSIFCSWMCERNRRGFTLGDVLVHMMQARQHHYCLVDGCKQVKQSTREALICQSVNKSYFHVVWKPING